MEHIFFYTLLILWWGLEIYLFFFYNRTVTKANTDKRTKFMILFFILFGVFGALIFDPTLIEKFHQPFTLPRYVSFPFIISGILIRCLAIKQLGDNFSVNVGVSEKASLKTDGLYKLVRHPAYFGEIVAFIGVAIAFWHPIASLFVLIFPFIGFLYRIQKEEIVLKRSFQYEYEAYSQRTKKIIPFVY